MTLRKAELTVNPPRLLAASEGWPLSLTLSHRLRTSVCAVVRGGCGTGIALPAVGVRWRRGVNPSRVHLIEPLCASSAPR